MRIFNSNGNKWKDVIVKMDKNILNISNYGPDYMTHLSAASYNQFWSDVFKAYRTLCYKTEDFYYKHVEEMPFMYNSYFKIDKVTFHFTEFEKHGIFRIKQLKTQDNI